MMLPRNLRKITGAIACVVVCCTLGPPVLAAEPHQNPETAEQAFSVISLFHYCSNALDFVLKKDPAEVEARLEKMPFANIPQALEEATSSFATSGISISRLVVEIDEDLSRLRTLIGQYRLDEATQLADGIYTRVTQVNRELKAIEKAAGTTARELTVPSALAGSDLRRCHDEVLERIERIREMVALNQNVLANLLLGAITAEKALSPTELILKTQPEVAFVNDDIRFWGMLTLNRTGLSEREIHILLNGSLSLTVKTEASGYYHGTLRIPHWCLPEIDLQALYYPRGKDIGVYISSLSPVIELAVLRYETALGVTLEDEAYPGMETTVSGRFDYGQSPVPVERKVEIYLDDVLIAEVNAGEEFSQEIELDPGLDAGEHIVTVSAEAVERHAPVVTSAILNVTRATPVLDINMSPVAMIPGSIGLEGRLHSQLGPVSGALVRIRLGESEVEMVSSEDGTFETEIKMGMVFSLIGSQDLGIEVIPQEPWNATLTTTRNMVTVNMISCGVFLILLAVLGIYLPRRLGFRISAYSWRTARAPAIATARSRPVRVHTRSRPRRALPEDSRETHVEPRNRILSWYPVVIRLVERIARATLKPQQTLREFARESSRVLGPVTRHFFDLTKMIERLVYSQYRATEEDAERSRQLSRDIEEGVKGERI